MALSACGVATDPEKGPVILQCQGERVINAANGERETERRSEVYRIDGKQHTFAKYDRERGGFGPDYAGLTLSDTEARYASTGPIVAGIGSTSTTVFDRVSGRVTDETVMSNGGSLTFTGECKPVDSPASDRKL